MSIFPSLESIPEMDSTPVGVSFSSLEYSDTSFLENIKNGTFSKVKIKSIIESNPDVYFNYDSFRDPKTRKVFQELWTNIQFLSAVLAALESNKALTTYVSKTYIRDVNTIVYDHMHLDCEDTTIDSILYDIALLINVQYTIPLCSKFVQSTAYRIPLFYFGTFDKMAAIERMHFCIFTSSMADGTPVSIDQLVFLYYTFFAEGFSYLFNSVMSKSATYLIESYANKASIKFINNVSMAVLNILNSMPTDEIKKVLVQYSRYLTLTDKHEVQFSLQKLPGEFGRLAEIVKECNQNGYYIP